MQFEKLKTFVLEKLHTELPHALVYHGVHHTKEVMAHAVELGKAEHLPEHEMMLLETAAALHDLGFITDTENHEEESCRFAKEQLPLFEYSAQEIESVCQLIMATKIPQTPFDKPSQVLCDADLYYLGTNNYQLYSERLHREIKHYNPELSIEDWHLIEEEFLDQHEYFTQSAKNKLNATKRINIKKVKNNHKKHNKPERDFKLYDFVLLLLGSFIAAFGLKSFLIPNKFLDGGITGISLLTSSVYHWNFALVFTILNIPMVIVGAYVVNRKFAIKTAISILFFSICTHYVPYPVLTNDKLLISIFGGFFAGIGMGLNIRAGSALDGIEVLAVYTLKRSSFTISEIILAINSVIFIIAAFHFGIETALYSILAYFAASKTVDYVVEGIEAYTGVTIISGNSEKIKERLVTEMGKGITIYKGERGFLPGKYEVHTDVDIIFTVITRLELRKLKNVVYAEDPKAFVFANTIKETSGGILKRIASH